MRFFSALTTRSAAAVLTTLALSAAPAQAQHGGGQGGMGHVGGGMGHVGGHPGYGGYDGYGGYGGYRGYPSLGGIGLGGIGVSGFGLGGFGLGYNNYGLGNYGLGYPGYAYNSAYLGGYGSGYPYAASAYGAVANTYSRGYSSVTLPAPVGQPYATDQYTEPGDGYRYQLWYNPATGTYFYYPRS